MKVYVPPSKNSLTVYREESGYSFSWKTGKIKHNQIKPAALAILRVELKLFSKSHLS